MSPTPDERRASWVEPGLAKRVENGEVTQVAIDLNRVQTYQGNGMTLLGFPVVSTAPTPDMTPHLILTPQAIGRLYRLVEDVPDPERVPPIGPWSGLSEEERATPYRRAQLREVQAYLRGRRRA